MEMGSVTYFSNHQIKLMTRQKFSRLSLPQPKAAQFHFIYSPLRFAPLIFSWWLKNYCALEWTALECGEHSLDTMAMCHRLRSLIIILHCAAVTSAAFVAAAAATVGWHKGRSKCEMSSVIGIKNENSNKLIIRIVWRSFFLSFHYHFQSIFVFFLIKFCEMRYGTQLERKAKSAISLDPCKSHESLWKCSSLAAHAIDCL